MPPGPGSNLEQRQGLMELFGRLSPIDLHRAVRARSLYFKSRFLSTQLTARWLWELIRDRHYDLSKNRDSQRIQSTEPHLL